MAKEKRKYADRAEYIKNAVKKRRRDIRRMAVEYKGSACNLCGYKKCLKALEFHHLDSSEKDFGIPIRDILGVGRRLERKSINASCFVLIVIGKCMTVLRSSFEQSKDE